jgi:hypothetical protein
MPCRIENPLLRFLFQTLNPEAQESLYSPRDMFTETIQKAPIMNGESMLDATIIVSTLDPFMEKITKEILFRATLSYPLP